MGLDFRIADSEEEVATSLSLFSMSWQEYKSVFHTPANRFTHLRHLSRIEFFEDAVFTGDAIKGLMADIECAHRAIANPSVAKLLEQLKRVCSKAVESGRGVYCYCD